MCNTRKLLAVLAVSVATLFASGFSHAALVSFTITGTVNAGGGGLVMNDVITATGVFDDSPLNANGSGVILFNSGSGNSLSIDYGGLGTLTAIDDDNYLNAPPAFLGPEFTITNGLLASFNYRTKSGLALQLGSDLLAFDSNGSDGLLGTWDTGTFSPVPVPAAVWLFGSGLIGLAGVARRKNRI